MIFKKKKTYLLIEFYRIPPVISLQTYWPFQAGANPPKPSPVIKGIKLVADLLYMFYLKPSQKLGRETKRSRVK